MVLKDKDLVARCQAGDRQAFRQLVEKYQQKVFGILYGMVRDAEDARDLTQDVFLRVYGNLSSFRGQSSFYTWLYRITLNISYDHLKKAKNRPLTLMENPVEDAAISEDALAMFGQSNFRGSPQWNLDTQELAHMVGRALESLSEAHRAVILLRELHGMSYDEMAQTLQCNVGTVMSRLFNARAAMKKAMEPYLQEKETRS